MFKESGTQDVTLSISLQLHKPTETLLSFNFCSAVAKPLFHGIPMQLCEIYYVFSTIKQRHCNQQDFLLLALLNFPALIQMNLQKL